VKHDLKTWPVPFQASWVGDKPWEFRRNDRDFQERDEVTLKEWDPAQQGGEYTGREIEGFIRFIIRGPSPFGIPDGFCIFTVEVTGRSEE
jgi:hypothetical protein